MPYTSTLAVEIRPALMSNYWEVQELVLNAVTGLARIVYTTGLRDSVGNLAMGETTTVEVRLKPYLSLVPPVGKNFYAAIKELSYTMLRDAKVIPANGTLT